MPRNLRLEEAIKKLKLENAMPRLFECQLDGSNEDGMVYAPYLPKKGDIFTLKGIVGGLYDFEEIVAFRNNVRVYFPPKCFILLNI